MNADYFAWLKERLAQQEQASLYRKLTTIDGPQSARVMRQGKVLINFSSNDYLSLANHSEIKQALVRGVEQYGVGSGASHLISGHNEAHEALQALLQSWLGYPSVTLFSSGYQANLAMLQCLLDKPDLIVQDKLNHASLIDGAMNSAATHKRFVHRSVESLKRQLMGDFRFKAIVTDGVFSMDGDIAPLDQYHPVAQQQGAILMVDDAHGLGVIGESGAGSKSYFGLTQRQLPVLMGTFGKAIGTSGAFIASSQSVAEVLTQFARPYIYTTASSPAMAVATRRSIELIQSELSIRDALTENINYFRQLASQYGLPGLESNTAIQPIILGDSERCLKCAAYLESKGFWVGAIRPPTVKSGTARLRITLTAAHTKSEIEQLANALSDWLNAHPSLQQE